jgi:hypothetical protein
MTNAISTTITSKSHFDNRQSNLIHSSEKPHHIYHLSELEQWSQDDWEKSGAGELFDANVKVSEGLTAIDKIIISDKFTTNTGPSKYLKDYNHLFDGGWFLPVLNPLADFAVDDWGCFKPVKPRIKRDGIKIKPIK